MNITYNVCLTMKVTFQNPAGRVNNADLTSEQIEILRNLTGYEIL